MSQQILAGIGKADITCRAEGTQCDNVTITAPMEVLAETCMKIKKEPPPHNNTFIAALCNGYLQYSPPASYCPRGGYEVTEYLLAPEWEAIFDTTVKELLAQV
jgi:hypothetical protein